MICITDTGNKPLNSLRLRPSQETTIRLATDSTTIFITSLQATRADFLLSAPTGEVESVSRGNGQELLDDNLIEIKLNGEWQSLSIIQPIGYVEKGSPIDVDVRVKSVGQAVGEVAFGLAVIALDSNKI